MNLKGMTKTELISELKKMLGLFPNNLLTLKNISKTDILLMLEKIKEKLNVH